MLPGGGGVLGEVFKGLRPSGLPTLGRWAWWCSGAGAEFDAAQEVSGVLSGLLGRVDVPGWGEGR